MPVFVDYARDMARFRYLFTALPVLLSICALQGTDGQQYACLVFVVGHTRCMVFDYSKQYSSIYHSIIHSSYIILYVASVYSLTLCSLSCFSFFFLLFLFYSILSEFLIFVFLYFCIFVFLSYFGERTTAVVVVVFSH